MKTSSDILRRMNSRYASMSKGQKILSAYISDNFDKAAFLTAAKLGNEVGVSESTVVRFAIFLGYKGYPEFQKALEEVVRSRLDENQSTKIYYGKIKKSKVLQSVLAADAERIKETLHMIDEQTFNTAVDTVLSARTIYIVGVRGSAPLAQFLGFQLNSIFPDVRILGSGNATEVFEHMMHISEQDVCIGISFPRYSMLTLKALEFATNQNAKVITITDSVYSPMNLYSSCNLLARSDMSSVVESMVAPMSVINALIIAISMKCQKQVLAAMDTMDHIREEYLVGGNDELEYVDDKVRFRYGNMSKEHE